MSVDSLDVCQIFCLPIPEQEFNFKRKTSYLYHLAASVFPFHVVSKLVLFTHLDTGPILLFQYLIFYLKYSASNLYSIKF